MSTTVTYDTKLADKNHVLNEFYCEPNLNGNTWYKYCPHANDFDIEKIDVKFEQVDIKCIPVCCFQDNYKLYTFDIPKSVERIDNCAFADCYNLSRVKWIIPSNVCSIGEFAFLNTNLTSIYIPKSVNYVGHMAFGGISKIEISYEGRTRRQIKKLLKDAFDSTCHVTYKKVKTECSDSDEPEFPLFITVLFVLALIYCICHSIYHVKSDQNQNKRKTIAEQYQLLIESENNTNNVDTVQN